MSCIVLLGVGELRVRVSKESRITSTTEPRRSSSNQGTVRISPSHSAVVHHTFKSRDGPDLQLSRLSSGRLVNGLGYCAPCPFQLDDSVLRSESITIPSEPFQTMSCHACATWQRTGKWDGRNGADSMRRAEELRR